MATHSSVLAWRIPGTGEPGGLLSMGSHRVGHDWRDLAAAAAARRNTMDKAWELQLSPCSATRAVTVTESPQPQLEKAHAQRRRTSTAKHQQLINFKKEVWWRNGEGNGHPLQYSCLVGYSLWGCKESGMTEATLKEKGGIGQNQHTRKRKAASWAMFWVAVLYTICWFIVV